jgi:hypothetical protein
MLYHLDFEGFPFVSHHHLGCLQLKFEKSWYPMTYEVTLLLVQFVVIIRQHDPGNTPRDYRLSMGSTEANDSQDPYSPSGDRPYLFPRCLAMSVRRFSKGVLRVTKNYAVGYSDTQAKVRHATSNDPWGISGTEMDEIAQMTYIQFVLTSLQFALIPADSV